MHIQNIIKNKLGLILSILIHILILVLPVSMLVTPMLSQEIELFVLDEEKPQPMKKHLPQRKKVEKKEPTIEKEKIIEPTIPTESTQPIISAPPAPVVIPEKVYVEPMAEPKDVEFGSAEGPKFNHREMPVYPLLARRLGKEGRVLLRLTIDEKGRLLNLEVLEGAGYGFTESAVEAVRKSTFSPAKKEGKPIPSRALLPIKFTLRRSE